MGKNIFTDGEIVATFTIPEEVRQATYKKRDWGEKTLADYVARFFGNRSMWSVAPSRSHDGSLTGTQVVIVKGGTQTIFMLVEPKEKYRYEVHVSKLVNDLEKEGSFLDVIDYEFSEAGRNAKKPLSSPFAVLAGIKDQLPRKTKNPGAPKDKRFRW